MNKADIWYILAGFMVCLGFGNIITGVFMLILSVPGK